MRAPAVAACVVLVLAAVARAGEAGIEEIVVTARKHSERLQDVPLAIDALGSEALARGSLDGLHAIAARLPGLNFDARWGGALTATVIRGQSQPTLAGDNVGVFVDGVYQANSDLRSIELLDIARVEVARGPQGTLFGHSTFAGAIHYVSQLPTARPAGGIALDAGSDAWRGAQGWVSGPLVGPLLARLALSARAADGTFHNHAAGGGSLGDSDRRAAALALTTGDAFDWSATLLARYNRVEAGPPAFGTLRYDDFNCGGHVPSTAAWSYYCGKASVAGRYDFSTDLPDSSGNSRQVVLKLSLPVGPLRLDSDTAWYRGSFDAIRDVDASSAGMLFGVCRTGVNCSSVAGGPPRNADRFVQANIVDRFGTRGEELSQELRLSNEPGGRVTWMLGAYAYRYRNRLLAWSGVARGDLRANEQLSAFQPGDPLRLGPVSLLNRALVGDPARVQFPRNGSEDERRAYGGFATLAIELTPRWRAGVEARAGHERVTLDSLYDSFRPSFRKALAPVRFDDVLPRFTVQYQPSEAVNWYVSHAKGSRAGGINPLPGLLPEEERYDPESNWTTELGLRLRHDGLLRALELTAFRIDWNDTQIQGFANTPGVTGLIVRNTAGVHTHGLEANVELRLADWLLLDAAWTRIDADYARGSDSPGDNGFCGLSARSATSSFCTVGPPRVKSAAGLAVVPYIDGNPSARAAKSPWHLGLTLEPPWMVAGWQGWLRADLSHQGDMSDRPVGGLRYGARTVLDLRLGIEQRGWAVELWARNLTDDRFISATQPGYPPYYPTQPRPIDLFPADGRRIGLTLRHTFGAP